METVLIWALLALLAVGAPVLVWQKSKRERRERGPAPRVSDARDTVADWPPTLTRVLSATERQAYERLCKALPDHMVLAQVPLARFIRVPTRYSYGEWLSRVGQLSADLVVCDRNSEVLAVVEIRPAQESERSRHRHQRMTRVLKAAGVRVLVWVEGELPTPQSVRETLLPREVAAEKAALARAPAGGGPLTTIPTAEVREGEGLADDASREPPPTTWYSDLDGPQPTKKPPPR
jgi:hypothetical protein